jgi:hypothetical protein
MRMEPICVCEYNSVLSMCARYFVRGEVVILGQPSLTSSVHRCRQIKVKMGGGALGLILQLIEFYIGKLL